MVQTESGGAMHSLVRELFPICRSITGDGLRRTLRRLQDFIPLELHEVASGTPVFDWTVPHEWNITDAWIADGSGRRVVDFRQHSLHVMSYSVPVRARMSLTELRPHLHTLPDHPEWIPYRTSYYREAWGFCLSQRTLDALQEGEYEVVIESSLAPGSLTLGECVLPGETTDELFFSVHCCHPSLANDNLAGMAVATFLARTLTTSPRRHTIRFLFIPGTIGSITWLALHEREASRIRGGLVLSCLGDAGRFNYKRSRRGNAVVDRAVEQVLRQGGEHGISDFVPYGYDERQYCSPGFDLPVGCLTRTPNGRYPEYHTSADDPDFVRAEALEESLETCLRIVELLDRNATYVNLNPKCEPQLGRRGLYRSTGGQQLAGYELALLWVLNQSDGGRSLIDITERSGLPFDVVRRAADALEQAGLLRRVAPDGATGAASDEAGARASRAGGTLSIGGLR
jgi:aminopeptidase-like protein